MKKGFTLVELLAVITVMGLILGLIITNVVGILDKMKLAEKQNLEDTLEKAAMLYNESENVLENGANGSVYCITLGMLQSKNLVKTPIIDPIDETEMPSSTCIYTVKKIENGKESYTYSYDSKEQDTEEGCFTFNSTTKTITDYSNSCSRDVKIPSTIGGIKVQNIGDYAFNIINLTSLKLPTGLITIGEEAFACNKLKEVIIPEGVTTIKRHAFILNDLENLSLPKTLTSIYGGPFNNNKLPDSQAFIYDRDGSGNEIKSILISYGGAKKTDVVVPNGVSIIESAFFNTADYFEPENKSAESIKSIIFPNTLTTIGGAAFESNELTSITFPSSVTTIEGSAFSFNKLTSVTLPPNITTVGEYSFRFNLLTSVTIPNTVTTIGVQAFSGNKLTSVTIPTSVTTIAAEAFENNSLTSIAIPNSVTIIDGEAFSNNAIPQGSATIDRASGSLYIGTNAFALNGPLKNTTITPVYLR